MALTVYSRITGTGSALPVKSVTNDELARELALKGIETNDEWIRTRTGICARRIASGTETTTTLAVAAGKKCFDCRGRCSGYGGPHHRRNNDARRGLSFHGLPRAGCFGLPRLCCF